MSLTTVLLLPILIEPAIRSITRLVRHGLSPTPLTDERANRVTVLEYRRRLRYYLGHMEDH